MTSPKFIHGSLLLMLALALAQKGMTQSARKGEGSQTNETNRPALSVQSTNPFPTNKSIATVEPLASTNAASIAVCYASATNPAAANPETPAPTTMQSVEYDEPWDLLRNIAVTAPPHNLTNCRLFKCFITRSE